MVYIYIPKILFLPCFPRKMENFGDTICGMYGIYVAWRNLEGTCVCSLHELTGGKHLNIASLIIYLWWRSAEAFGEEPAQTSPAHFITVAGNAWEIALLSCFRCMGNCTFFLCSCFICSLISHTHIHIRAYYVYFSFYCHDAVKWLGWFKSNCCIVVPTLCRCLMDRIYKLRERPLTPYMRLVIHLKKKPHISVELLMIQHNDHLHVCIGLGLRWRLIHPQTYEILWSTLN